MRERVARWQKTLGGSVVAHARVQLSMGLYQESPI
jgi:hypothetical protein